MTERKSPGPERAELVARIERAFQRNVNCVITPVEARGYLTTLRSLAAPDQKPVAWHPSDDVPNVARGASSQYILAVYRKRSGKVYSFAAEYLNAYPLRYEYGCPKGSSGFCDECSEDGCPTTGWHVVEGADDDGYTYHSLTLDDGDEVKGWREVPQWGEALSPPPAAGWDEATRYLKKIADLVDDENACDPLDDAISYANRALEALRHNAPPDSDAGKSADATIPTCCVTGGIPGDGGSCGDCDPCIMGEPLVPEAVKRLIAEKNSLIQRVGEMHDLLYPELPDHGGADAGVIDACWRTELDEIVSHLGSAIIQSVASDDQIIMDHVKAAHEIAKVVRRQA